MRIVIDLQGAQSTEHRHRGIGRYSLYLAQALVRNRGGHEVYIALNGLFPDTIEPLRAAFDSLLPQENIRVWTAPGSVNATDAGQDARRQVAELLREQVLASLAPDMVLVSSLFEGLVDDAVTSIGMLSGKIPTAVILYDLIPLIHRGIYLQNPVIEHWYEKKLDHLRRADLLLSISASSGQEAIDHLGFAHQQVRNISTAAEAHFCPGVVTDEARRRLETQYGVVKPFVMYTGGIDHRKNIEGLIAAYARLPASLRQDHQLAVVCSIQPPDRDRLLKLAHKEGLGEGELILTGFVPEDDLLACYRGCKLFIFPSWHEGFGLPALEAMQCGKAVIAANTSSLPEVVGREDALFDPFDTQAMSSKMAQVLSDDSFRAELEQHGLVQAQQFSWDASAKRAWQALEMAVGSRNRVVVAPPQRPRLAYVSPLPPQASGISDYSAELLPELARHYRIEVIVAQEKVTDAWVRANCPIRDVAWFRQHAHQFDRVLYHFGNSSFHGHMFALLREHPGVVVLHDFFLSGIVAHLDVMGDSPGSWARALLESHGWAALAARFQAQDTADVVWAYPANLPVLQDALGVIVHAEYSRQLARHWYGERAADHWRVIPHMRKPAGAVDRASARRALGVPEDAFIVCSFGVLGPHKLNHRLLAAWLASPLAQAPQCQLVFVGQNLGGDYGDKLVQTIHHASNDGRIKITGWADMAVFRQWLAAADVGVQLRALSRGETSGTVLDCMNYGLATIVNANGSIAELDQDAVWMLPDEFDDEQLIEALTTHWTDPQRRADLGQKARHVIAKRHAPRRCADLYAEAIEGYYQQAAVGLPGLLDAITAMDPALPSSEWPALATCMAENMPPRPRRRQLLVDISELVQRDAKSGIQRVVRGILTEWLKHPPEDFQIEPVYATMETEGYQYARCFISRFLGIPEDWAMDEPVEAYPGDVFLGLDLQPHIVPRQIKVLKDWDRRGVGIQFLIYDMLPILKPEVFPDEAKALYQRWLETVARFDGAVCISRAVADELTAWLQDFGPKRERHFAVRWFHLGADPENSAPSKGVPPDATGVLAALKARASFLLVGTIEPRKGHAQTLSAFEGLWAQGMDINLTFVGKQGWMDEGLVDRLRNHAELGKRLFWLEGISDEYLEKVYAANICLIAASEGEGFGLPLIEAAQHKLPIIARDIPVFREVAGEHAFYFDAATPDALAQSIKTWLALHESGQHPKSDDMPFLTWKESAQQLLELLEKK
ncbi:glycosyltransferase [Acidithiobacillus sp. CV18-2]|nr:glycosyltransferase [Acidithiobacillus sp. CV18-3]MBU2756308.1 glycosyltransferase [Acidithiobacillus sp. BN09-2]MBU2775929.1 glycosyltransferase [Acidithiobacillus sp. CV18-2]MBU2799117.1 glycosyltransferase [Acidithiobacillus sp. VAN18-4]